MGAVLCSSHKAHMIPSGLSSSEQQVYRSLLSAKQHGLPVVVITDIAKDYDDMAALLVLVEFHHIGLIELKAIVANLMPANERAKMTRRTLDLLKLSNVPVGIGTDACVNPHKTHDYEFSWDSEAEVLKAMKDQHFPAGKDLLHQVYTDAEKSKKKITLVHLSSLTDIDMFARDYPDLFANTTLSAQIQGANEFVDGKLVPVIPAANNLFDPEAAKHFHALLQRLKIPSTTFTKHAAYALPLPDDTFRQLAATKHPIGMHLEWLHFEITKQFYADSINNPYKADLTPQVILKTRTAWFDKHDANDPLPDPEEIRPYLKRPILYDAIAALGVLSSGTLDLLSNVGEWEACRPFTPNMRGSIYGEVGRVDEKSQATFHPKRMGFIVLALMKGALLR